MNGLHIVDGSEWLKQEVLPHSKLLSELCKYLRGIFYDLYKLPIFVFNFINTSVLVFVSECLEIDMMHFLLPLPLGNLVYATWGHFRVFKNLAKRHQDQVDSVIARLQSQDSLLSQGALTVLGLELCLGHHSLATCSDPPELIIALSGIIFCLFLFIGIVKVSVSSPTGACLFLIQNSSVRVAFV